MFTALKWSQFYLYFLLPSDTVCVIWSRFAYWLWRYWILNVSLVKSMEIIDLRGVAKFNPGGMIGTTYNGDHQTLLHTKYRSSGTSGFREEDFYIFIFTYCKSTGAFCCHWINPLRNLICSQSPTQRWFIVNLIKIGPLASEIFYFEIVDGRTPDACLSYKLACEPSTQVS